MIIPLTIGKEKRAVAILTPHEFHLLESCLNTDYKIRVRFLLQTAMRIVEARYVDRDRTCYRKENAHIFLPNVGEYGKARCTIKQRAIALSPRGVEAVENFFAENVRLPSYQAMEPTLKLAAREADIDPTHITTKMFRKMLISWLMTTYPEKKMQIAHSAGHDFNTMQGHYLVYGWKRDDIKDMRDELSGWGES